MILLNRTKQGFWSAFSILFLTFRVWNDSKSFIVRVKEGLLSPSRWSCIKHLKKRHFSLIFYHYTILHLDSLSISQVDSQRLLAQDFHWYVIPVIASYMKSFFGQTKDTLYILGKNTQFKINLPSRAIILPFQVYCKYAIQLHNRSRKRYWQERLVRIFKMLVHGHKIRK